MQIICFRDVAFGGSAEVVAVWLCGQGGFGGRNFHAREARESRGSPLRRSMRPPNPPFFIHLWLWEDADRVSPRNAVHARGEISPATVTCSNYARRSITLFQALDTSPRT